MVERLSESIRDPRVLDAMRRIPRHEFVPPEYRRQSYDDVGLPIPEGQSMYRPYLVARLTSLLELDGSERVLEVGTGSGYLAAILGELAREVYSIEILPPLKDAAAKRLEGLRERGVLRPDARIHLLVGDGSRGVPEAAPYEAIVVSAASRKVPVELINQLARGGRMLIPVGNMGQELQLIIKSEDGSTLQTRDVGFVRFDELVEKDRER